MIQEEEPKKQPEQEKKDMRELLQEKAASLSRAGVDS